LLQRKRGALRKAQSQDEVNRLEKDIENTFEALPKSGTTIAQLLNQFRLFKGVVSIKPIEPLLNRSQTGALKGGVGVRHALFPKYRC